MEGRLLSDIYALVGLGGIVYLIIRLLSDGNRVAPIIAWYDFWVGWYYDTKGKKLYIMFLPMIGIVINMRRKNDNS
jgi:hypothetical protein